MPFVLEISGVILDNPRSLSFDRRFVETKKERSSFWGFNEPLSDLDETNESVAPGPKPASVDGAKVDAQSIDDLVKADQHLG